MFIFFYDLSLTSCQSEDGLRSPNPIVVGQNRLTSPVKRRSRGATAPVLEAKTASFQIALCVIQWQRVFCRGLSHLLPCQIDPSCTCVWPHAWARCAHRNWSLALDVSASATTRSQCRRPTWNSLKSRTAFHTTFSGHRHSFSCLLWMWFALIVSRKWNRRRANPRRRPKCFQWRRMGSSSSTYKYSRQYVSLIWNLPCGSCVIECWDVSINCRMRAHIGETASRMRA